MKAFLKVFKIESKFLCKPAQLLTLSLVMVIALVVCKVGIDNYKGIVTDKKIFSEMEKKRISSLRNYKSYAIIGHRLLFVPSAMNIFFVHSEIPDIIRAEVKAGGEFSLNKSFRGKSLFGEKPSWDSGFSFVLYFLGGLLAINYGFSAFRKKNYIAMLASIYSEGKIYFLIFLSRAILMGVYFAAIFSAALLIASLNRIPIDTEFVWFSLVFYSVLLIAMLFMFSLGVIIGTFKLKGNAPIVILAAWLLVGYVAPKTVETIFKNKINATQSLYEAEYDALKNEINFEDRADRLAGKMQENQRNTLERQKLVESYCQNEYKSILSIDQKLMETCATALNSYRKLSVFFPMTFYISTAECGSSSSYEHIIAFWETVHTFENDFTQYYFKKQFYTTEQIVRNFVVNSENIVTARPLLPH